MLTGHRPGPIVALALLLLLCFGFAAPIAQAQTTVTVYIFNFDFGTQAGTHMDPTIHVGDTVHWVWQSGFHSTTSVAGLTESWDSGTHSTTTPAVTFDHTFTHTGNFPYYCSIHGSDNGNKTAGGMSGVVTVLPASTPTPSWSATSFWKANASGSIVTQQQYGPLCKLDGQNHCHRQGQPDAIAVGQYQWRGDLLPAGRQQRLRLPAAVRPLCRLDGPGLGRGTR